MHSTNIIQHRQVKKNYDEITTAIFFFLEHKG